MKRGRFTPIIGGVLLATLVAGAAGCGGASQQPGGGGGATPEAPPAVTGPTPADQVKRGGVLRGTWTGTLAHLDMHQVGVLGTWNAGTQMYNGLIEWDNFDKTQQKIIPALAKSWEASPDGMRFTFKLQEGVKFHDGSTMTVEDVTYSLNRIFNPPRGVTSARKEQFTMVDKVETPDASTVVVTTKYPSANFLGLLADGWHVIVPKAVLEKDANALKQGGVGTGPFVFKEFVPNQKVVMAKNPNYWRSGLPYLDGVELYRFTEETTAVAALVTNQLDMVNPAGQGITKRGAQDAKGRVPNLVVEDNPRLAIDIWRYNVTRAPLDKLEVRQALNLAIDRNQYQKFIEDGSEGITGTMVFPGSAWDLPKGEQDKLIGYEPNMEERLTRAKKLLADAGLAGGFTLTVMGPHPATVAHEDHSQALETAWSKINVKIKREPVQQEEARQRETDGLFDVYVGGYGVATIDPVGIIGDHFLCSSGRNSSKLCDQDLERLYEQQLKLLNQAERAKVVHEMNKRAVNLAAMNIINWNKEYHIRYPYVRDYIITPSRYTNASKMEYIWFDK